MPPMNAPQSVADQLRDAVKNSGLSAREVARRADVSAMTVSRLLSGKTCTIESAEAIAKAVGARVIFRP